VSGAETEAAEERGTFRLPNGAELSCRVWSTASPRAAVVVVHGIGEHSGRYDVTARHLAADGIEVHAFDLLGHGSSPGRRGHVSDLGELTAQVRRFHALVREARGPDLPLFLFGHSLGGLIALRSVQEGPELDWRGLVLSAPALGLRLHVPRWKRALGRLVSRLAPRLTLDSGIDPAELSRDPAVVAAYRDDPLVHRRVSARMYAEMMRHMTLAAEEIEHRRLPESLWLLPGRDRICDAGVARSLASALEPERVTVREYPGAYHEALNDLLGEQVRDDLTRWILARAG
jgi:lysophospholipase